LHITIHDQLTIDLDQATVVFLQRFYDRCDFLSQKWEDFSLEEEDASDQNASEMTDVEKDHIFDYIKVSGFAVRLNYKPTRGVYSPSPRSFSSSSSPSPLSQFALSFLSLRDTTLEIQPVLFKNVTADFHSVLCMVISKWISCITSARHIQSALMSMPFIRNISNIAAVASRSGSGFASRSSSRQARRRRRRSLATTIVTETLDVTAQVTVHMSKALDGIGSLVGVAPYRSSAVNIHRSSQPQGIGDGVKSAAGSMCEGLRCVATGIREKSKDSSESKTAKRVGIGAMAVLYPTQSIVSALYSSVAGVRNHFSPRRKRDIERKYKQGDSM
jgi:hypothetical protein